MTGVIVGWGGCLLPLGATRSTSLALAGFAVGGLIYAPFPSITMTLFQRASPARDLTAVLAAQGSIIMLAPPLGAALGGPLVAGIGASRTLLLSAAATLAVGGLTGLAAAITALVRRARAGDPGRGQPPGARPASAVRPRRTPRRTAAPSGSARDG